jgi:hypothetical protein
LEKIVVIFDFKLSLVTLGIKPLSIALYIVVCDKGILEKEASVFKYSIILSGEKCFSNVRYWWGICC